MSLADADVGWAALEAIAAYFIAEAEAGRDNEVSDMVRSLAWAGGIGPVARAHIKRVSRARGTGVLVQALVDDRLWNNESDKDLGNRLWLSLQPIVNPMPWDVRQQAKARNSPPTSPPETNNPTSH